MLTALALSSLAALFVMLFWLGPDNVGLGFALWALANVPLLLAAYSRTRSRVLLWTAALLVIAGLSIERIHPLESRVESLAQFATASAALTALPVLVTLAWLTEFHGQRAEPARRANRMGVSLAILAVTLMAFAGAYSWTLEQSFEHPEDTSASGRYAGCYEVRLDRWLRWGEIAYAFDQIVPERIQLDTTRGSPAMGPTGSLEGDDQYHVHRVGDRLIRPGWVGAEAYWQPVKGGRVQLYWTNGLAGVLMRLEPSGNDLRGVAMAFGDVVSRWPEPRGRARALRIDCGAVGTDAAHSASRPTT